ncbi:porin [Shewanella mesophila]|uniref:DcaP family trimeric outer membrane transporter n=1 Tax=Shewanella mesophila TaxID=2864208 RepID=UPI001C65E6F4|nr:DcaP family trimeric outer membrane transporter [Shewanella mesophila]QYJ86974.1 porin [Shewanella mesophila]
MLNNTKLRIAICSALLASATPALAYDFNVNDTDLTIGGYIKLTGIFDSDGTINAPYNGDLYSVYSTPIDGSPNAESSDFRMTARESRIFLKSSTETDYGKLTSHFEGDFFADIDSDGPTWSNSHGFRIRHAYFKMENGAHSLLAGQTWTNFMDFAGSMPSLDFASDPGSSFVRQPQVRYQYNIAKGQYASVSFENPTLGLTKAGPFTQVNAGSSSEDLMPDIVAKYFYANKHVTVSPRAVVRRFELDGNDTFGYGLALNSSLKFGDGHKAVLGLMYGDGIGRYAGLGFNAGAGIDNLGDVDTLKFSSINGGVIFSLKKDLRLAVGAGYSKQDEEGFENGILTEHANKTAFSWHTNLFWNITSDVEYAIGVRSGEVENMGTREGDMTRFQTYLKYTF